MASSSGLPLADDGYPAAGGVARRPAGEQESARANRRWWDAAAPAYLAEHGSDLGDADFLWCPEGLREAEAHLLGDVSGRRVLEIGCGSAPCSRWLRTAGADVVALDLSAGMLARAAELNRATGIDVPLLQADAGALPEVVGSKAGIRVKAGDVGELTAALELVLDSPSLADQLGRAGRRRVLDSFTWRSTAQRTADWYAETLDRKGN